MAGEFHYGGQAVIEGVMMRGRKNMAIAVRRPSGEVTLQTQPLKGVYTGTTREAPILRGGVVLAETLILGTQALLHSANLSLEEEGEKIPASLVWVTVALALILGIALFFVAPLFITHWIDPYVGSSVVSNLIEGIIRLGFFITYLAAIGLMPDIRRVFAYHGAEHKAVNAYEDGAPIEVDAVRNYNTAHARCGTSFLLIFLVIAILVFALLGRPPMWLRILSRIALIPVIAVISYELMRFGAAHLKNSFVRALLAPGLALQSLTTRRPDDRQLEVAIAALKGVLEADRAEESPRPDTG